MASTSRGGRASNPPPEEANVLVTAFDKLPGQGKDDASLEIARQLPTVLAKNIAHPTTVRIFVHPQPIEPTYSAIDAFINELHNSRTRYDIILHLSAVPEHNAESLYTFETAARRDVFSQPDSNGDIPPLASQPGYWRTSPARAITTARIADVKARWTGTLPDIETKTSADAGEGFSAYLYYTSLAHYLHLRNNNLPWRERTTVAAMHAPTATDDDSTIRGAGVVRALILALVDSRRQRNGDDDDTNAHNEMIMVDGEI